MNLTKETLFNQFLLTPLSDNTFSTVSLPCKQLKKAAVLWLIVERHGQLFALLTQRSFHLRHHPGQFSFPGGKVEKSDANLWVTALRETQEEIGIEEQKIQKIGQLPSIDTMTGFSIYPQIGWVDSNYHPKINSGEVAHLYEIPLNYLLNKENIHTINALSEGHRYDIHYIPYGKELIWGATAQIIYQLYQMLR